MSTDDLRVVLVTAPEGEPAQKLATALVEEHLAACVNQIQGIRSTYRWEGKLMNDGEDLLVIKTTAQRFPALRERILALHPYEVPEILALPVTDGAPAYMDWVRNELKG